MNSVDELIQNVIDTLDNAHTQKIELSQQLDSLAQAKQQVTDSSSQSREKVKAHFENLEKALSSVLNERMQTLLNEVEKAERSNLEPLQQCEDMINLAMGDATTCMEQGKGLLESGPEEHVEDLMKFKDAALTKDLNIVPEVPGLSEVACLDVVFCAGLAEHVTDLMSEEGKLYERAPVQITEVEERPGAILVKWEETHDDVDVSEYCLQYSYGRITSSNMGSATFHTAYSGTNTSHLVRRLRTKTPYSFRVGCRGDKEEQWSVWSVPYITSTNISHYEWDDNVEGYSASVENKTGTRTTGLTRVLYSKSQCYKAGWPLSFRILDSGEKSPTDGIGIAVTNDDIDTMKREGAVFLACDGTVYIDGQEMKTRLPCLSRNSSVAIETETLPNGKVRVSVQVEGKELTFDWKIDRQVTLGMIGGLGMNALSDSAQCFFFAMIFSHEDWKVTVE